MAGIIHKIEETLHIGGHKEGDEHKKDEAHHSGSSDKKEGLISKITHGGGDNKDHDKKDHDKKDHDKKDHKSGDDGEKKKKKKKDKKKKEDGHDGGSSSSSDSD